MLESRHGMCSSNGNRVNSFLENIKDPTNIGIEDLFFISEN